MKVLMTVPSTSKEFGGPFTKAIALSKSLRDSGVDIEVIGAGSPSRNEYFTSLGAVGRFHATPIPRSIGALMRRAGGADVVHILGYRDPVGTIAGFSASHADVAFVLEPCGMHRRRLRSETLKKVFDWGIGGRIVDKAARIVATSSLERGELMEGGVTLTRIELRPNGIDISQIPPKQEPDAFRKRWGIPRGVPLVLSLGRIARGKGLEFLLRALSKDSELHALIAGPDSKDGTLAGLTELTSTLNLEGRVVINDSGFWGEDKVAALDASDVFCLPSLRESFGTSAAEAAGSGLPVVVAEGCGVVEYLPPETTRIIRFEDETALAVSLAELANPVTRSDARARSVRVQALLSWDAVAKKQLEIYQNVLGNTQA